MNEIVKQIRKTKRTKEWNDKDNTVRYSNINLVTKFHLEQCLNDYLKGKSVSAISKEKKVSYDRLKKAF